MQDSGLFMMSPMDSAGEMRLAKARACIRKTFGPSGSGRRTKRALEMADETPMPSKTPRTKIRQRIAKASLLSTEKLFFQQFGSSEELMSEAFDLARPAGRHTVHRKRAKTSQQHVAHILPSTLTHAVPKPIVVAPTSYFSFASKAASNPTFLSSLPPPSTAIVSHLTRPMHIHTPRKASSKRDRAGESSAEKELVLQKPRLSGVRGKNMDLSDFDAKASNSRQLVQAPSSSYNARKSFAFVTNRVDSHQPIATTSFFSRASPSKIQFSSSATRLFSQRQAPRR
ncbi:hypothetical protein CCR75_007215 [Bremia lactucae]|uniref:Uncharacterized protein n=1 Tax=Bremia lactucae TaxID=4779 RepID=A0A976FEQ2_BRELC|nr:hypothetical protein CCR75_007215 [Bremia lactucae]